MGQGAPQDYAEAAKWFRRAADQGRADAKSLLGTAYINGEGVPQDYATTMHWYRKAADQGQADAQYNLGIIYFKGEAHANATTLDRALLAFPRGPATA
jgi:TPR repeat protein